MTDDFTPRPALECALIDVNQPHELRYWSQRFGVDEDELRKAVQHVGPMAHKVEEQLARTAI